MRTLSERAMFALVSLNLALQVFDGVATYVGVHAGIAEGNPLLAWALAQVGPAFALVLFKLPWEIPEDAVLAHLHHPPREPGEHRRPHGRPHHPAPPAGGQRRRGRGGGPRRPA